MRAKNNRGDAKEGFHVAVVISGDLNWAADALALLVTQHKWRGFDDAVNATFLKVLRGVADPNQLQEAVGYAQIASGDKETAKAAAATLNFPESRAFDPERDPELLRGMISSNMARLEDLLTGAEYLG